MSLSDRVKATEGANCLLHGVQHSLELNVEMLKRDVGEIISLETIAAIMSDNPQRARNELKSACRQALTGSRWQALSAMRKNALTDELLDVVFGMGPIEGLIADESVTEIMVNGAKSIFFERDGKLVKSDVAFESNEQVRVLIDRIISPLGKRVDESSPMVDARLPQGHRVHAVIPPIAIDGPNVTIRAFTKHVITLEEMRDSGSFDRAMEQFLGWLIRTRQSIAVCGGTGSGKTTMLNAMSRLIAPDERIVTIEDSAELKFNEHEHVVRLEARPRNAEGVGEVTIRELVINSLRMRPDRIIVGECRSGEALDMLQAMNTGHDGSLTTIHCNEPEDVVDRLITMVRYAVDLPADAIEAQIGHAFDYVVQVRRSFGGKRYLSSVAEVSYDREARKCSIDRIFDREEFKSPGSWLKIPILVEKALHSSYGESPHFYEEVKAWRASQFGV